MPGEPHTRAGRVPGTGGLTWAEMQRASREGRSFTVRAGGEHTGHWSWCALSDEEHEGDCEAVAESKVIHHEPRPDTGRRGHVNPCWCFGPWYDIDPADQPDTALGREHEQGGPGCEYPRAALEGSAE